MSIRIRKELDYEKIEELGYTYSIGEGGYISSDYSTYIGISRCPYNRQVMQYSPGSEEQHQSNIEQLRSIDALEE